MAEPKPTAPVPKTPNLSSDGSGVKATVTIRFKPGQRDSALRDWFADNSGPLGVTVAIPELGLSRRYKTPDDIPAVGDFAPGHHRHAFIIFRAE